MSESFDLKRRRGDVDSLQSDGSMVNFDSRSFAGSVP